MVRGSFKPSDRVSVGASVGIRSISPPPAAAWFVNTPSLKQLTLLGRGNLFLPRRKSGLLAGEIQFSDGSEVGAVVLIDQYVLVAGLSILGGGAQLIGGDYLPQPGAATKYSTTLLSPSNPSAPSPPPPANANVLCKERNPPILTAHKWWDWLVRELVEDVGSAAPRSDLCVRLSTREGVAASDNFPEKAAVACPSSPPSLLLPINSARWEK